MSLPIAFAVPAPERSAPLVHWTNEGQDCSARWRSERGAAPPSRVLLVDDTLPADQAFRLASEGAALLWQGDFHNARQLLQAMARRADRPPRNKRGEASAPDTDPALAFHRHRMRQAQRARLLGALLIPMAADYAIELRRAPDLRSACALAWGDADPGQGNSVVSLRELLGVAGAAEWRRKGVVVPALGPAPNNRIHPHYGVFSPVRGEYLDLVAMAPLPVESAAALCAFDIGTGTGVLAALLARRGIGRVVGTDLDPRALACARGNLERLGLAGQVSLVQVDLFPPGQADLIVCNPPWLPARPSAPIEAAIYDEGSRMLLGFLRGLPAHLTADGEGWLILSDLAEHLALRTRAELQAAIADAGLVVIDRLDARPKHPKALDPSDPLHRARASEVTSLWRLRQGGTRVAMPTNPPVSATVGAEGRSAACGQDCVV